MHNNSPGINWQLVSSTLMLVATAIALIMSNSHLAAAYQGITQAPIAIGLGDYKFTLTLEDWVNDLLMAIFFLRVSLELKVEFYEGHLRDSSQIALPMVATIGGMIIPMLFYYLLNSSHAEYLPGVAIPCATDIAFAMCAFNLFAKRMSNAAKIMLLSIAVFDDIGAMLIIILGYSSDLKLVPLALAGLFMLVMIFLSRKKVDSILLYLLVGLVLWIDFRNGGISPTMAGVVTGLLIPMHSKDRSYSPVKLLESWIGGFVDLVILPVFAFVASGVYLAQMGMQAFFHPICLGVIAGLFLGKQVGIFGFSYLMIKLGLADLPRGSSWYEIYFVSVLSGIGFTMSLFMSFLAFDAVEFQDLAQTGVMASLLLTAVYAWLLSRLGR